MLDKCDLQDLTTWNVRSGPAGTISWELVRNSESLARCWIWICFLVDSPGLLVHDQVWEALGQVPWGPWTLQSGCQTSCPSQEHLTEGFFHWFVHSQLQAFSKKSRISYSSYQRCISFVPWLALAMPWPIFINLHLDYILILAFSL